MKSLLEKSAFFGGEGSCTFTLASTSASSSFSTMSCCAVARIAVHFVHRCFLRVVDLERFVEQRALRLLHRPTLPAVTSLATDHFRVWVDRNVAFVSIKPAARWSCARVARLGLRSR